MQTRGATSKKQQKGGKWNEKRKGQHSEMKVEILQMEKARRLIAYKQGDQSQRNNKKGGKRSEKRKEQQSEMQV